MHCWFQILNVYYLKNVVQPWYFMMTVPLLALFSGLTLNFRAKKLNINTLNIMKILGAHVKVWIDFIWLPCNWTLSSKLSQKVNLKNNKWLTSQTLKTHLHAPIVMSGRVPVFLGPSVADSENRLSPLCHRPPRSGVLTQMSMEAQAGGVRVMAAAWTVNAAMLIWRLTSSQAFSGSAEFSMSNNAS